MFQPLKAFFLAGLAIAVAGPALATVKDYDGTRDNGTAGDTFGYTTTQCPPIRINAGNAESYVEITDDGDATPDMTDYLAIAVTDTNIPDLTSVFGPGSFVFVQSQGSTTITSLPHTGAGFSDPSSTIAWGVVSGWESTGIGFCISSPQTICTGGAMLPHGETSPLSPPFSPTFDLGTWTFDTNGDFEASQYITRTIE